MRSYTLVQCLMARVIASQCEISCDFGIEYKEQEGSGIGNVYYNGQLVKTFADKNKDGRVFTFQSVDGGEIVVHTVYDENGKLIGMEKAKN